MHIRNKYFVKNITCAALMPFTLTSLIVIIHFTFRMFETESILKKKIPNNLQITILYHAIVINNSFEIRILLTEVDRFIIRSIIQILIKICPSIFIGVAQFFWSSILFWVQYTY